MADGGAKTLLRVVGGLLALALGAATGHGVTSAVLAVRAEARGSSDAVADSAPRGAAPASAEADKPAPGCCSEAERAHARPADLALPTEGVHGAVARGDLPALRRALDSGTDLNARDGEGRTLIAVAVLAGRIRALRLLLDRGADGEIGDREHVKPVMLAARFGDTAMVDALLAYGIELEGADDRGLTALMRAAENDHAETAARLLEHGVAIDRRSMRGLTALMLAVAGDAGRTTESLLAAHAGTELRDDRGATALAIAAEHGRLELAQRLLDARAVIDAADHGGLTPIGYAFLKGSTAAGRTTVAELLARRGASFELELTPEAAQRVDLDALAALARRHGKRLSTGQREEGGGAADTEVAVRRLIGAVPRQSSRALPSRVEQRLVAFAYNRWQVANVIARVEIRDLKPWPGVVVVLAGDAAGRAPIRVDDALLFESYDFSGKKLATDYVGTLQGLRVDDVMAQPRSRSGRFDAGSLNLTPYLDNAYRLVISAIDWGWAAELSDVYLVVQGKDAKRLVERARIQELP